MCGAPARTESSGTRGSFSDRLWRKRPLTATTCQRPHFGETLERLPEHGHPMIPSTWEATSYLQSDFQWQWWQPPQPCPQPPQPCPQPPHPWPQLWQPCPQPCPQCPPATLASCFSESSPSAGFSGSTRCCVFGVSSTTLIVDPAGTLIPRSFNTVAVSVRSRFFNAGSFQQSATSRSHFSCHPPSELAILKPLS